MVATLVKLKWRLTLNALTKNVWAIIGTVFGALYGVGALAMVLAGAVGLGLKADADVIMLVLGALGALLVAGWAVVPLLITGLDSTLDPRAMAAWAAPSRGLALGLLAAGAVGIPGCITAAVCLIPVLTWLLAGQLAAALLALLCAPAALATCVLLSRIIVTAAGISSSRRGRETTAIIAFVAFMVCTQLPNLIPRLLGDDPTDILQPLGTLARVMGLSPFGWAFAAPGVMATGSVPAALALAIGAWILPVILLPLWQRVVNKAMTSPGTSHTRTRAYAADGAGSDVQHRGLPDVLPWARRLSAALPAPAAAVAARSLRYWRTDPRYLVQFVSVLILPVVLVLGPALNSSRFVVYVNGQRVETSFALGHAPTALLFMAPALAVFMGWALHDDLGMDSTALWSHLSAGISGAHDRLGRVVGAAVWQAPVMLVVDVFMVVWTGRWEALPAVTGACLALYGSALAWSCLASVLLPYETLAPGDSPMRSRTSGTAFLAAL
ncbi:transporter, partial [Actinomyces sp.]